MRIGLNIALLAAIFLLSACAGYNFYQDPYGHTKAGAAVGAVTGAVIGHQLNHRNGSYAGGAAGALIGGAVGNYMDQQQRSYQQALDEERRRNDVQMQNRGYYTPYSSSYPAYSSSPSYPAYPNSW